MLHELLSVLTHVTSCLFGMIDSTTWNCGEPKSKPFLHSFIASVKAFYHSSRKSSQSRGECAHFKHEETGSSLSNVPAHGHDRNIGWMTL